MLKYIAFLRAINIGGRRIKMAPLRALFEELGLAKVESFIASGNIIFDPEDHEAKELESRIASHLHERLDYEVDTFIRTNDELAEIVANRPFQDVELVKGGNTLFIAFLSEPVGAEAQEKLLSYQNEVDEFLVKGVEVYWLRRGSHKQSKFSNALLEKAIGGPATLRNLNTLRRLLAKYPSEKMD
mgnify:CR=1 FL=1